MLTGTVLSLSVCQQDNSKGCGRIWITFCRPLAYGARTYVAPHPIYGERVTRGGGQILNPMYHVRSYRLS